MGPLKGIKVVELAGIGPGPMCAMLLADLGATVLRIERKTPAKLGIERPLKYNLLLRGRKQIAVDLKAKAGVDFILSMVEEADALIEGFRPGVTERLGLGPQDCLARNPRLVYGRMTGWGQSGPLAQTAGHDLNYIALTGALAAIGRKDSPPTPPLTLAGDLGGGGLYLAFGMLAALIEARQSGKGQVVDAGISDCAAHLMTNFFGMYAAGLMSLERGTNFSDSGAPYYDSYICADGHYVSIAPIEEKFFDLLLEKLGFAATDFPPQNDRARWPEMRRLIAGRVLEKTRDEWCAILEGTDVCFAPVLTIAEAPSHPHMKAREVFLDIDGVTQPAPAPRFSRTPAGAPYLPKAPADTPLTEALHGWQIAGDVQTWTTLGAIG